MRQLFIAVGLLAATVFPAASDPLPIRGIHFSAPSQDGLEICLDFIRNALPKEGVNTLVLEINYGYDFQSHPELSSPRSLNRDDIKAILAACREGGIELIPQFNCLGHQSWDKTTFSLLTKYPELDESPGKYPENKGIYCRSYCPQHPKSHEIVFALLDELADAFEAKSFHVGMDEVFIIGDDACPRCQGKNTEDLFALEVNALNNHLTKKGITMWMWSDRFLNGNITGLGEWEASINKTEGAIHQVPKNIVMCDWHYEKAHPTAAYFAMQGFPVLSCPWRKPEVALSQLELIRLLRKNAAPPVTNRLQGMLHTTWCGMVPFVKEYNGQGDPKKESAVETVQTFKVLFAKMREEDAQR